ncbi:MAG: rhomboid family intramembrane serine protease [Verrucomicrobia bacterium]|nr:MAG: rhomboid family intramembrane serine protease [Verrucomicrobiota bacterium]
MLVDDAQKTTAETPVWARAEAFPQSPSGWGWQDRKLAAHRFDSEEAWLAAIEKEAHLLDLVWTPQHPRMVVPEEIPELHPLLTRVRAKSIARERADTQKDFKLYSSLWIIIIGFTAISALWKVSQAAIEAESSLQIWGMVASIFKQLASSNLVGMLSLGWLIFAFIPWYQARKREKEQHLWNASGLAEAIPVLRMEAWLERQRSPLTYLILSLIIAVAAAQLLLTTKTEGGLWNFMAHWQGIAQAGLFKDAAHQHEWWRRFTAPFLHGNALHIFMNGFGLAYLGKRLEVFARWPHLVLVFLFAGWAGSEASFRFIDAPTVGASGALMGWLGFLLVFENLHRPLVPKPATRRLMGAVLLTGLIGIIGYRYIDNAAHLGGLLAGMAYAFIVFPKSTSSKRPRILTSDFAMGTIAIGVLVLCALWAALKILTVS